MATKFPLSGELSRRQIGGQSGVLRRLSRQADRDGHGGVAAELAMESAKAQLGEQGVGSAEEDRTLQRRNIDVQHGLLETQRRSLLNPSDTATSDATAPATGDLLSQRKALYSQMQQSGATPATRQRATELGVTDSGFNRAAGSLSAARTQASAPAPVVAPPLNPASNIPSLLRRTESTRGMIDGKPAVSVLAGLRNTSSASNEPGSLAEMETAAPRARPVNAPGTVSQADQLMGEAMARREARAAAGTAAGATAEPAVGADTNQPPAPAEDINSRGGTLKGLVANRDTPATRPSASTPSARFPENNTTSVEERLRLNKKAALKDPNNRPTPGWLQDSTLGSLLESLSR